MLYSMRIFKHTLLQIYVIMITLLRNSNVKITILLRDEIPVFLIFGIVVNNCKSGISSLYLA